MIPGLEITWKELNMNWTILAVVTSKAKKVIEATPAAVEAVTKSDALDKIVPGVNKSSTASAAGIGDFLSALPYYVINLFFFSYLVFLWFLMVRWVGRDCQGRGVAGFRKRNYQILVLVFNFPGLLLYLFLRPSMTVAEVSRGEMEEEILRLELEKLRREADEKKDS